MEDIKDISQNIDSQKISSIPQNLWDKYTERLKEYSKKRDEIQVFIKDNLKEGIDFGKNDSQSKKNTLLKSGAEKISDLIEGKIKIYPDIDSWNMLGKKQAICYVGYLIDQTLLSMIIQYLLKVGMQWEQHVVKLFAWGEGRGAYELDEKTYGDSHPNLAGKPLKGSMNRAIKIAEKRTKVDVIIGTLGLDFSQDEDYGEKGNLKDDNNFKKKSGDGIINIKNISEENKALFHNIMVILNTRENKISIFSNIEKTQYVKKAASITDKIEALREIHASLTDLALKRVKEIQKKLKGEKNESN